MRVHTKIFVFVFLALSGCKENRHSEADTSSIQDIEKIELRDLNDLPIDDNLIKGKAVFLNFWATWCKPCIIEMEYIDKAQNQLLNEDVVFILASSESKDEIRRFQNHNKYKFMYVQLINTEVLDIPALPTTFIFNRDGKLVFAESGVKNWADSSNINMIMEIINQ